MKKLSFFLGENNKKNRQLQEQRDELKLHTQQLQKQQEELKMLSAVASMTSNSIFITNANGEFIWLNDAFTRDTGITIDQIGKHPALKATAMPPESKRVYEKMLATKEPQNYISKITHVEGVSIWVQTAVTPVFDDNGDILMVVWVNTNITELRETTQMLEELHGSIRRRKAKKVLCRKF
jgi:hypothetical protein